MTGSVVSPALRQRVRDLATPVARGLGRLGLTPNALTIIGFVGTCVAAYAAANQAWLAAGVLVVAFGIFDLFDGTLARATGTASNLGAFLDSIFDRAGEAVVYIGIAIGFVAAGFPLGAVLAASAMGAAFLVSYARAKSESLGFTPGTGMANIGLAPREVRIGILALGLVLAPVPFANPLPAGVACSDTFCEPLPGGLLTASLAAVALLSTITTIQRILHVARAGDAERRQPEPRQSREG